MNTEKTIVGLVQEKGSPIACIVYDAERRTPVIYAMERLDLDGVVELLKKVSGTQPLGPGGGGADGN